MPSALLFVEDDEVRGLLKEVYIALQADARRIAMMGCRAILDRIMVLAVKDVGSFSEKLNKMEIEKHVSAADRKILETAIEAGSASAHRGYQPTPQVLEKVVSIVEHFVQAILLREVAEEIKARTPRRAKQAKQKSSPEAP